jgi:chromosome segregation ATPase
MSVKAVPELEPVISGTDFVALEEKIYRTIELLKSAREARAEAEREAVDLRERLEARDQEIETLHRQVAELRSEREDARTRVEKILEQIDQLTETD